VEQLFKDPKPLIISGVVLTCIAIIPNMPHFPLLSFAFLIFLMTYFFFRKKTLVNAVESNQGSVKNIGFESHSKNDEEIGWHDVRIADRITLEIGYGLIQMVGVNKDGALINRIKGIRKKISQELGFLVPTIRVKDNLELAANN
jgi:flagellar biosynthesis protein FlhA